MVLIYESELAGHKCTTMENDNLKLWITCDIGPRLLGLSFRGGDNLLAILPDMTISFDGMDDYSPRGGHRLWSAPEVPEITYIADDRPVEIKPEGSGLKIIQEIESPTGIQKSWKVTLQDKKARVKLIHTISNQGDEPVELAPWAITQFRPGGTAILPLQTDLDDDHGLLPNRQIVLWPYTELDSPWLDVNDRAITVRASMKEGALKVGAPNPAGWIAYTLDKTLFVKRAAYDREAEYLDRGASSQIYCGSDFIELETLGPVGTLSPGEFTDHQEIWEIYSEGDWPGEIKQLYKTF